MFSLKNHSHSQRSGFSLVETALAIGILSFGVVSVVGLLPVALSISRQSADRIAEARMIETVRATLLDIPSSTLSDPITFVFDAEGEKLTGAAASGDRRYYQITATPDLQTQLPNNQTASKLFTAAIKIEDTVRRQERTVSVHLPYNGF